MKTRIRSVAQRLRETVDVIGRAWAAACHGGGSAAAAVIRAANADRLASGDMGTGDRISDELVLRWWNEGRAEPADGVTAEMRSAYAREVVHPELIARFDASLAELLSPSEWTFLSSRLYSYD